MEAAAATAVAAGDLPLDGIVGLLLQHADAASARSIRFAIDADVVLETGTGLEDTSAQWFVAEDGVGNNNHWIKGGDRVILDDLALGLELQLGRPGTHVAWDAGGVTVLAGSTDGSRDGSTDGSADGSTDGSADVRVDRCICSLANSVLRAGVPVLSPGLPASHRRALGLIGMDVVDKVLLRFERHWWPTPDSGCLRWSDTPPNWCEWVDLSNGCGAPVVAGLIAHDAVARHHDGRTDDEIAFSASEALASWAAAVRG